MPYFSDTGTPHPPRHPFARVRSGDVWIDSRSSLVCAGASRKLLGMFPLIGYVTRFEQQDDRFSASVDVQVPEDVSHVQLDTEVFGSAAHAVPLRNPRNAELANISVHGPGHLKIQVGDETRVMCFKTGELPECIISVHRLGVSSRSFPSYQRL